MMMMIDFYETGLKPSAASVLQSAVAETGQVLQFCIKFLKLQHYNSILGYNWCRCHASNCLRQLCLSVRQSGIQTLLIYLQTDLSVPESRRQTISSP